MYLAMFGPWQIIIILLIPVLIFLAGYHFGKKAGYIKRVKEEEAQRKS
jgi:hypothetical protein